MSRNIYLVGVDGSEWSERATERAVNLAADTGAEVHLMYVIQWSAYQPLSVNELSTRPIEKKEEARFAEEEVLKPLMDKFAESGVSMQSSYDWGHPSEVIHEAAKKEHARMIFVGRRGRSRMADLLLGSVANRLAHHAGVPVVLVP